MKKLQKGFTLVELMIVVAIIAVLAAVALPAFGSQIKKAKDGKAVSLLGTFRSSLSMVQSDLEGEAPAVAHFTNIIKGGNTTVYSSASDSNVQTKVKAGVSGWNKMTTLVDATGNGTMNCGTPTKVNWTYSIDGNDEGKVAFSDAAAKDTKDKTWADY